MRFAYQAYKRRVGRIRRQSHPAMPFTHQTLKLNHFSPITLFYLVKGAFDDLYFNAFFRRAGFANHNHE
jgi:hypothetical protein